MGGRPRSVQRKAVSVEDMLTDHLVELIGQVSKPLNPVTHTARVQIARRGSAVCDFTADLDQNRVGILRDCRIPYRPSTP